MDLTLTPNILGTSIGTWAAYRAQVLTLADPGMAGHDTGLTLSRVQDGGRPAWMTYNASTRATTIGSGASGTQGNPTIIEGWDFNGGTVTIQASHIIIRNCLNDLNPVVTTVYGGTFGMFYVAPGLDDIRVEYCTFRGRHGLDKMAEVFQLQGVTGSATDGSGVTYATNVIFRRNVIENLTGDAIKGQGGAGFIVEENWFKGMYQFEAGTRYWTSAITFALDDYCVSGEYVYRSLANGNLNNATPTGTGSNAFWGYVGGKAHCDYTQQSGGPLVIWRGNLMDATKSTPADGLNTYFRFGNEQTSAPGVTGYNGPRKFLGNVCRRDQSAFNGNTPINALQIVTRGTTLGPYEFDGNSFHYAGAVIANPSVSAGALIRFGPDNIGPGGVAVTGTANTGTYAGDPVPVFGALEL